MRQLSREQREPPGSDTRCLTQREHKAHRDFIARSAQWLSGSLVKKTMALWSKSYGSLVRVIFSVEKFVFGGFFINFAYQKRDSSSVGRASASQAEGRGFEPRLPLSLDSQIVNGYDH